MHVFLHIGLHKTGTTFLQYVLHDNRARLRRRGVGYPDFGPNHGWPLVSMLHPDPHLLEQNIRHGLGSEAAARARAGEVERALEAALRDPALRKLVISGEQLSSVLSRLEVAALRDFLQPFAEKVTVLAYVREPVSFAASMMQQRLKSGDTLERLFAHPPRPNYRRCLRKYLDAFGRDALDVRIYDRRSLIGNDIVPDVLAAIGEPADCIRPHLFTTRNAAMSHLAAIALDARNRIVAGTGSSRVPRRSRLFGYLPGPSFRIPEEVAARIAAQSAKDVAWLERLVGFPPFTFPDERTTTAEADLPA